MKTQRSVKAHVPRLTHNRSSRETVASWRRAQGSPSDSCPRFLPVTVKGQAEAPAFTRVSAGRRTRKQPERLISNANTTFPQMRAGEAGHERKTAHRGRRSEGSGTGPASCAGDTHLTVKHTLSRPRGSDQHGEGCGKPSLFIQTRKTAHVDALRGEDWRGRKGFA